MGTPKKMIERRERERWKDRYREGKKDKREREVKGIKRKIVKGRGIKRK